MRDYEDRFRQLGYRVIVGVDEAGRGPLAGPVVAAAVVLRSRFFVNKIDDSKKLSALQRERACAEVYKKAYVSVAMSSHQLIDEINIRQATKRAMERAVAHLLRRVDLQQQGRGCVLVDGDMSIDAEVDCVPIVAGDAFCQSIAAASIVAKVMRDRLMRLYHRMYPLYGFAQHKGYPTPAHKQAVQQLGLSSAHRVSFCGFATE